MSYETRAKMLINFINPYKPKTINYNMEMDNQEIRKRNVAFKLRIGDILKGVPMVNEGKFLFLELGDKKVVRINIIANCVDKFVQEGERQFASLTIDDASGQIRIKAFGEDIEPIKNIMQGDTLQVVGNIREWNGEIYIIPEIMKKIDTRWLLVRKLEIQNSKKDLPVEGKGTELKNKILDKIKLAEEQGGIDTDALVMNMESNPDAINSDIKKLLEEGLIYEPRPGRLRYLG